MSEQLGGCINKGNRACSDLCGSSLPLPSADSERGQIRAGPFLWVTEMRIDRSKFVGTNPRYKHLSQQERWIEYGRRKAAWVEQHGYADPSAYDAMIKRLCDELGI